MAGSFVERISELIDAVGDGPIQGKVEYDQIYAHYQHEGLDFKHPQGGEAEYLRRPALGNVNSYMHRLAEEAVTEQGSRLTEGMIEVTEDLAQESERRAPFEFGALRGSSHPSVESNGEVVYDRPPENPRLSEAELKARRQHRRPGTA